MSQVGGWMDDEDAGRRYGSTLSTEPLSREKGIRDAIQLSVCQNM